ncbi:hypothetical protein IV203_008605 [Nitzschia inconspicua]|uniref:Uncharacterized protein n=1 Tax=Nitzschia inconspicua TaxID=303405 RepID=A0A9K3PM68_9STRA|nr:hypothetical protein IV203_008605 [Nitzschia inconspicua]
MFSSSQEKDSWKVDYLVTSEPAAIPYLQTVNDDEWDDTTLASTPSMKRGRATTIVRNCGEPSDIIISVEHRISMSKRAFRKFWRILRSVFFRLTRQYDGSSGISNSSTEQPSLGVMGVIV